MTHSRAPYAENRRPSVSGLRRGAASLVLALFVAVVPVMAHDAFAANPAAVKKSFVAPNGSARLPDVGRNGGAAQVLVASRPIRERRLGLDSLTVVAIVAGFAAFRRRAELHSGARFLFNATFAPRRGPPSLHAIG